MGLAAPIEGAGVVGVAGVPAAGRVTRGVAYSRLEIWELRTRGDETNLVVANKYPNPTPRHKVAVSQAEEALAPFGDQHCQGKFVLNVISGSLHSIKGRQLSLASLRGLGTGFCRHRSA